MFGFYKDIEGECYMSSSITIEATIGTLVALFKTLKKL